MLGGATHKTLAARVPGFGVHNQQIVPPLLDLLDDLHKGNPLGQGTIHLVIGRLKIGYPLLQRRQLGVEHLLLQILGQLGGEPVFVFLLDFFNHPEQGQLSIMELCHVDRMGNSFLLGITVGNRHQYTLACDH